MQSRRNISEKSQRKMISQALINVERLTKFILTTFKRYNLKILIYFELLNLDHNKNSFKEKIPSIQTYFSKIC